MSDQISTKRATKSSPAAKLLQAAALAAVLVPLGSIPAEASTCGFSSSGASSCQIFGIGADEFAFFDFADPTYKIALAFDHVVGVMEVTINAFERTEAEMLAKFADFPGFRPVPIGSNPAMPYIEFQVLAPTPCFVTDTEDCSTANNTWISEGPRGPDAIQGYDMRFYWTALTDAEFPDPHVLHDTGPSPTDGLYDFDMTDPDGFPYTDEVPCEVFDTCEFSEFFVDPAVGGRDDMFDFFSLGDPSASAVPEPASLVLLGTGISSLLYRRRRRK